MRVLMVSGIRTTGNFAWDAIAQAFKSRIPDAKFCVATEPSCNVWEISRFRKFIVRTAAAYDTGEDMILVGHSMGGVMACAIQPLLHKTHVLGITTVHSPHRFLGGLFTHMLGARNVSAPVISFQGLHDGLVWWGTRHPQSILHVRNHANHFHDLWEHVENADLIAETTIQMFLEQKTAAR